MARELLTRTNHWEYESPYKGARATFGYFGTVTTVGLTVSESLDMELPKLPAGWTWGRFMRMRDAKEGLPRKVIFWRSDEIIHFDCYCSREVWQTRHENCPIAIISAAAEKHAENGKLKGRDWLEKWINLLNR